MSGRYPDAIGGASLLALLAVGAGALVSLAMQPTATPRLLEVREAGEPSRIYQVQSWRYAGDALLIVHPDGTTEQVADRPIWVRELDREPLP